MNIKIFIATHNRAEYLKYSIESILNQVNIDIDEIIVLDNESIDDTEKVVKSYPKCKYIKTTGFLGNFNKARKLANKKYIMLYHDDDVLNPHYLSFASKLIEKYNPSFITTKYTRLFNDDKPVFNNISEDYYLFNTQKELVRYMLGVEGVSYSSAIYRTDSFLAEQLEYEKYGKFNDWSFMAKMGKHGKTIITSDQNINFARIHGGQDTRNKETCVTGDQIINWDKFFYDILQNDILTSKSYHFLKSKYDQFTTEEFKNKYSFEEIRQEFLRQCPNICQDYNKYILDKLGRQIASENLHSGDL